MTGEKSLTAGTLLQEMFQFGFYKRTQGRLARQATLWAMVLTVFVAAYRLYSFIGRDGWFAYANIVVPAVVLGVGLWVSFRLVNYWRFADFLIAVEAEMNKVSWPSRGELYRSTFVVIFVLFSLSLVLFSFDIVWRLLFQAIGVVQQ